MAETAAARRTEGGDDTAASDTAASDASTDLEGDLGDVSADQEARDTGHQELVDREARLAEVEVALGKLAMGTYGACEQCGRPIPVARLRVLPEDRYDVVHEAQMEDARASQDRE
jgi:DnaK suppressor protein